MREQEPRPGEPEVPAGPVPAERVGAGEIPAGSEGAWSVGRRPKAPPRAVTLVVSGALLAVALLVAMLVPVPYAVQRPGPTVDTLDEHDGEDLIRVEGAETYPTSGELRLTTVSVVGGPGFPVTAIDVLRAWIREDQLVLPGEAVFPDGSTREQLEQHSSQQMASSQTNATVAALEALGHDVPMTLAVIGAAPGSGAEGLVEVGDVVSSIRAPGADAVEVSSFSDLAAVLRETEPGQAVTLGVRRGDEEVALEVTTSEGPHGAVLGVFLDPAVELPFEVSFDIDDIGGPSAGMMFALGIIDRLSPEELTGGEHIAGTGTLDLAGQVGAIGGIRQKLVGARRDGAEWFLAPASNCDEVLGHVPEGLEVVAVGTLAEARDAVEALAAGRTAELPRCEDAEEA